MRRGAPRRGARAARASPTADRSPDELAELLGDAVAAIADADPFDASVIARAPGLRVVARTGVGLDSIDLEAATSAGVVVTITPGVNNETVADHTLALMPGDVDASWAATDQPFAAAEAGAIWFAPGTPYRDGDAVHVLTAHGAAGREFHTVVVVGTVEGNFPSLSRPEPMFDLEALDRLVSQSDRNRARLEDERRLFRMVLGRARERVVLMASRAHADEASTGSRFVEELGLKWSAVPDPSLSEPISVSGMKALSRM